MNSQVITNVIRVNFLGPWISVPNFLEKDNSCCDISFETTNVNVIEALHEKLRDHQRHYNSSRGRHKRL